VRGVALRRVHLGYVRFGVDEGAPRSSSVNR
jgi:hypothetical protein